MGQHWHKRRDANHAPPADSIKVRIKLCGRHALAEIDPFLIERDGVHVEFHGYEDLVPAERAMRQALSLSKRYGMELDVDDPRSNVIRFHRAS